MLLYINFMMTFDPKWLKDIKAEIVNKSAAIRSITVTGEGKVVAYANTAIISFSIITQEVTVKQVTSKNTQKLNLVTEALKKMAINGADISVAKYSLYPEYEHSKNIAPKISGYSLEQELIVKVKKMDFVDRIIDALTKQKVNKITLVFDIADPSLFKKQAREMAFSDAQKKAREMVKAAGVKLGQVVTFSENEDESYPTHSIPSSQIGFSGIKGDVSVVESGSKEFSASVNVTYEIE